jgi:hypothetical protein
MNKKTVIVRPSKLIEISEKSKIQYVYILSLNNKKLKNILKIGETNKRHPEARAYELSKETSALGEYIVEWYMEVPNSKLGESLLHDSFTIDRFAKEHFQLDLDEAIKKSEDILNNYFKPFGKINKYVRQKNIAKFGNVILNDQNELMIWWQSLPLDFKFAVFHLIAEYESYLRLHVEKYVQKNNWIDIHYKMLLRKTEIFKEYPSEWENEPHLGFEHIFEKDNFYITEMLKDAAFEDYWWFKEIFSFEFVSEVIDFDDLQKMFKVEKIANEIIAIRSDASEFFPFLKRN